MSKTTKRKPDSHSRLRYLDRNAISSAFITDLEIWAKNDPDDFFWFRFVNVLNGALHLTNTKIVGRTTI
jgi:hypothetical protein